jgi:hypothetical protein
MLKTLKLKLLPKSRLHQLWCNSQTKAWAYLQGAGASGLAVLSNANLVLNDQHFKDYLSNFAVPKSVYIGLATMALITWLAHGRSQDA